MTPHKAAPSVPHDKAMVGMLKADPDLAEIYLATALDEASLPCGQFALLAALRHIAQAQAQAQGMVTLAE